jgi:hypothetical protein
MDVLKLLHSQNRCLLKLLDKSRKFLADTESGDLSSLQFFQNYRDTVIKALILYDNKVSETISKLSTSEKSETLIESVRKTQVLKEELLQAILCIDQKIITRIEDERNRLLQELSISNKNNQLVRKFKSTWIPEAGEKLDGKI